MTQATGWRWVAAVALLASITTACTKGNAAPTLRVSATEMRFAPAALRAQADTPVVIQVENTGDIVHTFSINELGIDVKVPPGEQREFTMKAPGGRYSYVCRILDHEGLGMAGTMLIK